MFAPKAPLLSSVCLCRAASIQASPLSVGLQGAGPPKPKNPESLIWCRRERESQGQGMGRQGKGVVKSEIN